MTTIFSILSFISMINISFESLKALKIYIFLFLAELSWAWKTRGLVFHSVNNFWGHSSDVNHQNLEHVYMYKMQVCSVQMTASFFEKLILVTLGIHAKKHILTNDVTRL